MPQSLATSLQEKTEERVPSTVDQLLLYLSTIDESLIPKEEYSQLSHLGGVRKNFVGAWDGEAQVTRSPARKASITASI